VNGLVQVECGKDEVCFTQVPVGSAPAVTTTADAPKEKKEDKKDEDKKEDEKEDEEAGAMRDMGSLLLTGGAVLLALL
jgi:ribosomal protein L12E/L44/L45/RPP1/RPP2